MNEFQSFRERYELPPVHDYTFLGTEQSHEKPIVRYDGRIELWFDPAEHVPWIKKAIDAGSFEVGLVDGCLPAVKYTYKNPGSNETCEMTAFAVDRDGTGAIRLLVRLVERSQSGELKAHCFRLRDQAAMDEAAFENELKQLREHWKGFFEGGAKIASDDPVLLNACKASIIRALITFTGRHPHYGVRGYAPAHHDGFPPTIISLVNCLMDWGHVEKAREYLLYYFQRFVTETGRFDYYGPSLAEYGQMLHMVRRLADSSKDREWLAEIQPKLERMCEWLWAEQANSKTGLITGVPEADTRHQVDVYFHNNTWCWRGLRDIGGVMGRSDEARCEAYRRVILSAVEAVTDKTCDPPFIPPVARRMAPFKSMTQDDFASYTNYRYWLELLSSGILPKEQMDAIVKYRVTRGGEVGGMTAFRQWADNWPIFEYGCAFVNMGKVEDSKRVLFSHLAGHVTPGTWTAYEQVSVETQGYRRAKADYCVPVQLVAPRLLAWILRVNKERGEQ